MRESDKTRPPWGKKLLVGLGLNLLLFGALEAGLHLSGLTFDQSPLQLLPIDMVHARAEEGEGLFRLHPDLFWELRPGFGDLGSGDAPSEQTFRGPLRAREKPDSAFRIALMGDSCTYGVQLSYEQTYGARLEEFLSLHYPDRRIEVMNGGVPGYTLFQGSIVFREKMLPLRPDVAVFYFGWNDSKYAKGASDSLRAAQGGLDAELSRLATYRMVKAWKEKPAARTVLSDEGEMWRAWVAGNPIHGYRVPPEEFEAILDEALVLCQSKGIHPIVILPEYNMQLTLRGGPDGTWSEDYKKRRPEVIITYRERAASAARRRGATTLDMRALFADRNLTEIYIENDEVHPDANGNLLLASALWDIVRENGWVEECPPGDPPVRPRSLRTETVTIAPGGTVRLSLDGGVERAGKPFLVVPAWNVARAFLDLRIPVVVEPGTLKELLRNPDRSERMGYAGQLDDEGRATTEITAPADAAPGRMLGFAFTAGDEIARTMTGGMGRMAWVSNGVWVRIDAGQ